MRSLPTVLIASSLVVSSLVAANVSAAAQVAASSSDRILLSANGSSLTGTDGGGGGSLNWLHYFSADALVGIGAEHQYIAESRWTFGTLRGSLSRGEGASKFNIFGEAHYGEGDEDGRDFDYGVAVLGISQSFTPRFSVQLETRQIDIDTTRGNLPKLGLTYLLTPRLVGNVSYAHSVGGNLGTELFAARIDYYGRHATLLAGGASGNADPAVLNVQPGSSLPAQDSKQGFVGIGKTFKRGEVQLVGDYLEIADSEKVTVTLSFTGYLR